MKNRVGAIIVGCFGLLFFELAVVVKHEMVSLYFNATNFLDLNLIVH